MLPYDVQLPILLRLQNQYLLLPNNFSIIREILIFFFKKWQNQNKNKNKLFKYNDLGWFFFVYEGLLLCAHFPMLSC